MFHRQDRSASPVVLATLVAAALVVGCDTGSGGAGAGAEAGGDADTARIAAQLDPAAVARIEPGDGGEVARDAALQTLPVRHDTDTTWAWQLQGEIDLAHGANVQVIDLFAHLDGRVQAELDALGRDAFCYFSVGTFEPWRPDADLFDASSLGAPHALYPDERWLDVTDPAVVRLMVNRLDMARAVGCDGVELDNVDAYLEANETGLDIDAADQVRFARILANEARSRGLHVALKNAPDLVPELVAWFDLSIVEECFEFDECEAYLPMVRAGRPVFVAEYRLFDADGNPLPVDSVEGRAALCAKADALDVRALLLPVELDGSFRFACDD